MPTITISKELIKDNDLIAVPRDIYEEFLNWQKKVKSVKTFIPTATEKKDFKKAREDYKKGKYTTLHELKRKLGIKN